MGSFGCAWSYKATQNALHKGMATVKQLLVTTTNINTEELAYKYGLRQAM